MSRFVLFHAKGVIYGRDKNGNPIREKEVRRGEGVVQDDKFLYGSIFRQCSELLACDHVTVETYKI